MAPFIRIRAIKFDHSNASAIDNSDYCVAVNIKEGLVENGSGIYA